MSLFKRIKHPVSGTAQVLAADAPPTGSTSITNGQLRLAVTAPGLDRYTVEHRCLIHVDRWPRQGDSLPVTVDRSKPERLKIEWDQIPSGGGSARAYAVAEGLRAQGLDVGDSGPPTQGQPDSSSLPFEARDVVDKLQAAFPGATIETGSPETSLEVGRDVGQLLDAIARRPPGDIPPRSDDCQIDSAGRVVDCVQAHPLRYIQAIGVRPEDSYGFVPNQQWDGPVGWVLAYRDGSVTNAGRANPGNAPPGPTIAIDRLYPKLRQHDLAEKVDHWVARYRELVGLCAADTYGLLPLGVGRARDRHYTIWQSWYLVYVERPEYRERRKAYAEALGEAEKWPPAQVIEGTAVPGPPLPAEPGKVKVTYFPLPQQRAFGTPGSGAADAVAEALAKLDTPPERVFAICPDYRQQQLRAVFLEH